jgi:hypothetical protein
MFFVVEFLGWSVGGVCGIEYAWIMEEVKKGGSFGA